MLCNIEEASNKNFENTRDLCGCLWQKMVREREKVKRDNFHCYWKFNVPEVAAAAKELLEQHHSTQEIKKELAKMRIWCYFAALQWNNSTTSSVVSQAWKEYLQTFPIYFDFHSIYYVTSFGFFLSLKKLNYFSLSSTSYSLLVKSWEWIWMWN